VGRLLSAAVGDAGVVLHDRAVPRGRANIDHIAVVPSGVWVIDTKRYRGRVRRSGRLGRDERSELSARFARAFPPYRAPGASPRREKAAPRPR
jgi:hypothetical protein